MLILRHISPLALLVAGSFTLAAQQNWTLQRYIDHAVAHDITVEEARLCLAGNEQQLSTAQHSCLPSPSASASRSVSLGRSADKTSVIGDQSSSSTSFGANFSQNVFSDMARPKATEIARLGPDAAVAGLSHAKEQTRLQVVGGYYNLLFRRELIHVANKQLKLTRETLTETAALVRTSKWSRDRLAEVETQLAKDSVSCLHACNDTELTRRQLALIIGLPDYTALQIALPDVRSLSATPAPELTLANDALLEQACTMHPRVEQARLQLQMAKQQIGLEQTNYIPKVSFGAGYNAGYYYILNEKLRQFNQPFRGQMRGNGRYFIGLSLSVPILDAIRTADNVAQARLRYSDQQIALRKVDKELTQQLYAAQINARAAYSQIGAAQWVTELTETALHYTQISHEAGCASSYKLIEAQNYRLVAQSEELHVRYNYLYRVPVLHSYISPAEETKWCLHNTYE